MPKINNTNKQSNKKTKKPSKKVTKVNYKILAISVFVILFSIVGVKMLSSSNAATSWQLYWSDEFNGTSVDTSRWGLYHNTYGDGNKEEACLTPNNAVVSNGTLKIISKRETVICPTASTKEQFTSAFLSSRSVGGNGTSKTASGKFYPAFARYEMRAKLPHGQGVWPAFWLRHIDGADAAEIDIMEYFHSSAPGKTTQTLHFPNEIGANVAKNITFFETPTTTPGWHTWAVEIVPTNTAKTTAKIIMYQDGVKTFEYTPTKFGWLNNFDKNAMFDIAINSAVGGTYVGHPDDELSWSRYLNYCLKPYKSTNRPCDGSGVLRASFPMTYEIDYIKMFTPSTVTTQTKLSTPSNLTTTSADSKITLNWTAVPGANNYTVRWGQNGVWNYSNGTAGYSNPTTTTFTVSGLTNGQTYDFQVAARDSTNVNTGSDYSGSVTGTPSAPVVVKLSTPTNLTATSSDGKITLNWTAVPGANNYTVRWGQNGAWTNYSNDQGPNPTTNSYTVTGLARGKTYNFSVAARDSTGVYIGSDYSVAIKAITKK